MPYNTRRKSLSLPSLGIHIPVSYAARAANSKSAGRSNSSSSSSSAAASNSPSDSSTSTNSHPSKRLKKSHGNSAGDSVTTESTPPPSPTPATSVDMDADTDRKVDLEGINDDIVEAVITQLEATANRPHLVKDLAILLGQSLTSVQNSANPCAIISSRLASYMKRTCWSASSPCPLAKELEAVHPRRTYYFLTTGPRQPLPDASSVPVLQQASIITPSVSLTDDSGSDDIESRRRELSPSPELDLPSPDFEAVDEENLMPVTPPGSLPKSRYNAGFTDLRNQSPPLEKDEREFTQTANGLLKRKFADDSALPDLSERSALEYGSRDDIWSGEYYVAPTTSFLTSPAMKASNPRTEEDMSDWLKFNVFDWDRSAESIEIEELDGLLDGC